MGGIGVGLWVSSVVATRVALLLWFLANVYQSAR